MMHETTAFPIEFASGGKKLCIMMSVTCVSNTVSNVSRCKFSIETHLSPLKLQARTSFIEYGSGWDCWIADIESYYDGYV